MSKVKIYQKAWSQALKGDFSLVDQIYHPEYRSFDLRTGIYTNIDDDKVIVTTENEEIFTSYPDVLYENDEFLCIIAYQKVSDPETRYRAFITAINYKEGKIPRQKTALEELDTDQIQWSYLQKTRPYSKANNRADPG